MPHMNAIDEQRRRTFESDWLRGGRRDIVDYLPQPEDPSFLATLEELICIDLEFRLREVTSVKGNASTTVSATVTSLPAVEDYLVRFPQLNDPPILARLLEQEIRARLRTPYPPSVAEYEQRFPDFCSSHATLLRLVHGRDTEIEEKSGYGPATALDRDRTFGKYELLDVLGRGGMGVVYRARQAQTDRQVAIKIAGNSLSHPEFGKELSRRFQTEIRAAANVSHENVLPIYDVGEFEDRSYYSMPILDGDLSAEVRRNPLANERAAKYVSQAARGVAAAHAAGLLHRDLKPHNLLLDRAADRVLVTDFGLARAAASIDGLTRAGEILGSPPYMSPEQIRDPKDIDGRADVYALGATLYHLLVGRPPFQAATSVETLRQSLDEDPVSPRLLNKNIDADLETICLRCLQKDRQLRFESARELADELDRYLRGEPIVSRPLGWSGRLARWCRRNPNVAMLATGLVASLILLPIVAAWGWYRTQQQLDRVVAHSKHSQAAINELFTFVRSEPLLDQPATEEVRQTLLATGLRHYEGLIALSEENDSLLVDRLAAQTEFGLLYLDLKEHETAESQLRQVVDAVGALPKERRDSTTILKLLGDTWNGLGQALHATGNDAKSLAAFDRALELRRRVVSSDESDRDAKRKLANTMMNHGLILASNGNLDAARAEQETAQRMRTELEGVDAADPKLRRDLAQGEFNLARLELLEAQGESGIARLNAATDRFKQLTDEYPTDARNWIRYVECLLTKSMFPDGTSDDPANSLRIAIAQLEQLALLAPKNRGYRLRLVELWQQGLSQLLATDKSQEADDSWRQVGPQMLDWLEKGDQRIDAVKVRLNGMRLRGLILLRTDRKEEAKHELMSAIEAWRTAKEAPNGESLRTPAWESTWAEVEKLTNSL